MMIAARNSFLMSANLPYDAEVDYLKSTGTQWINTGIVPTNNFAAECTFAIADESGPHAILASLVTDGTIRNYLIFYDNNNKALKCYGAVMAGTWNIAKCASVGSLAVNRAVVITATISSNNLTLSGNGTTSTRPADTPGQEALGLLGAVYSDGRVVSLARASVYGCKLYLSGSLVRDFIPVRVGSGSSAVGYLYDRVSGELFGNAGTGAFVIGPDK